MLRPEVSNRVAAIGFSGRPARGAVSCWCSWTTPCRKAQLQQAQARPASRARTCSATANWCAELRQPERGRPGAASLEVAEAQVALAPRRSWAQAHRLAPSSSTAWPAFAGQPGRLRQGRRRPRTSRTCRQVTVDFRPARALPGASRPGRPSRDLDALPAARLHRPASTRSIRRSMPAAAHCWCGAARRTTRRELQGRHVRAPRVGVRAREQALVVPEEAWCHRAASSRLRGQGARGRAASWRSGSRHASACAAGARSRSCWAGVRATWWSPPARPADARRCHCRCAGSSSARRQPPRRPAAPPRLRGSEGSQDARCGSRNRSAGRSSRRVMSLMRAHRARCRSTGWSAREYLRIDEPVVTSAPARSAPRPEVIESQVTKAAGGLDRRHRRRRHPRPRSRAPSRARSRCASSSPGNPDAAAAEVRDRARACAGLPDAPTSR